MVRPLADWHHASILLRLCATLLIGLAAAPIAVLSDVDVSGGSRFIGFDVAVEVTLPPLAADRATVFNAHAGGGWQRFSWFRNANGDAMPGLDEATGADFRNTNGELLLWLRHGLVPHKTGNSISLLAGPRLTYESYRADEGATATLLQSGRPDATEILQASYFAGVAVDTLSEASTGVLRDGWLAAATFEHAPGGINQSIGGANFARGTLSAAYFIPIVDAASVQAYLAQRVVVDVLDGEFIPALVQARIGGLRPESAIGGAFRGLPDGRLDARLKTLASVDLRASWITGLLDDVVIPGVLVYVDAATASALDDPLRADNAIDRFIVGVGSGISARINIFSLFGLDVIGLVSFIIEPAVRGNDGTLISFSFNVGHQF